MAGQDNAAFGQENEEGNFLPIILSDLESGPTPESTLEPTPEPPDSAGTTILASKSSSGVDANAKAINASLSGDGRQIPFSVLAAGFNVIGWYWFVWGCWRETRGQAVYPIDMCQALML